MINTLQLLLCIPGFQLIFPSNAQYMLSLLISIGTFDIINPLNLIIFLFPHTQAVLEDLSGSEDAAIFS